MNVAEALAHVDRLCAPEVAATLRAAMRRPSGGHALPRAAVEVGRVSLRPDPRAEDDGEPTRRERLPSNDRLEALRVKLTATNDALETSLASTVDPERVIGAPPWKAPT